MRILIVGATGTIGNAVCVALESAGHDLVRVGHSSGDHTVDLSEQSSIRALYDVVGNVDAVVCTAGQTQFGAIEELTDAGFALSIDNKMMGQVNLVRQGVRSVTEGGSFTLTSGTLSVEPTCDSAAVAMAGAGVEGFVRAVALDLHDRYRVNVVSPGWVAESRQQMGLDPMPGIWAADLAKYYLRCLEGDDTGQVLIANGPVEVQRD